MIATLQFNLPDDKAAFDAAVNGRKAMSALWGIDQRLRSLLKHGEPTEAESRLAEQIREMIPAELLDI